MTQASKTVATDTADSQPESSTKHTLTLVNDTNIDATVQVWHAGARVYNEDVTAGASTVFTPGLNKKNFNAVFRFSNQGAPKKVEEKGISLKSKSRTVSCQGRKFYVG